MRQTFTKLLTVLFLLSTQFSINAQKRIYLSNDDHTDYMWTADSATYQNAFLAMLDAWLDINDATSANTAPFQSKWNCDGTFWLKTYQKYRTPAQFDRLINQVRSGKVTVPYSSLVLTYGSMPAESILRSMYYAGQLERDFALDFDMAIAMENQTLPLGLASLWKGAGAKYCWHGVCDCTTQISGLTNRQKEIYWYKGLDTNRVLLKWYSMATAATEDGLGGYAEARFPRTAVAGLTAKTSTTAYPYDIAAGFGYGWDDVQTTTEHMVDVAIDSTNAGRQVIVSNEVDFFRDFENTYGNNPELIVTPQTFGNEWDHACASIAEVSAKVKRSQEKLRAAEAMAAIVINYNPTFASTLDSLKKEAWMALGLYWEHSLGFQANVTFSERYIFQNRLENVIASYVDQLYTLAQSNLGNLITNGTSNARFYVFNPLNWVRTDYADYVYSGSSAIQIFDVSSNTEVPFQLITKAGVQYIRVEAAGIPSLGYKVFEIRNGTGAVFTPAGTKIGNVIDNNFFTINYTNQGVLSSIFDKVNAKEIVAVTSGKYVNDLGTGLSNTGTSIVENVGPVSITILATAGSGAQLAHSTRITVFKNIPRIEIDNQVTQNFDNTYAWSYSFNIANPEVWHEETGAVIKAKLKTNGGHYATQNARYDWNTINHFASVNETDNSFGVSVSNQDCYFMKTGNSSITTLDESVNSRQINILAGGGIDGYGFPNQGDIGENRFNQRFAITTHTTYSATEDMKRSLEHQNFMVCGTVVSPVNFLLPNQFSYVSATDPNAIIWALKPAEEGWDRGIVTRVWNLSNSDINSNITYGLPIALAKRTTHVETDMVDVLPFTGNNLSVAIGHNEMKTFRIKLNLIALPVNALSFEGDKVQGVNILKWSNKGEDILQKYELERSTNGQQFNKISSIAARSGITNSYTYNDNDINPATPYYYRLKMINSNNSLSYSNTVLIKAAKEASNILIFPNPVTDILKANFVLDKKIRCNVAVINAAGAIVKTTTPLFERGNNYYMLPVKELPAGEYIFSVTAGDQKFIKAFIKK